MRGENLSFNNRLKELREEKGLTQKELSKLISASQSKIAMWETGNRDPNSEDIIFLSKLFDVTTDYILGCDNEKKSSSKKENSIFQTNHSNKEKELLKIFAKLKTEIYQDKAIDQFKGYVDCIAEVEASSGNLGKDAQSTPSKKNVG